jgi:hypothetical protein
MRKFLAVLVLIVFVLSGFVFAGDDRSIIKDGRVGFKGQALSIGEHGDAYTIDYNEGIRYDGLVRILSDNVADLDIAVPKYYQIQVPVSTTITASITLSTVDGAVRLLLSDNETVGAAGVTMTAIFNPNFTAAKTTTVKFYEDSNTTNASAVYYDIGLAGTAAATNPSGSRSGEEVSIIHKLTLGAGTWIIKLLSLNDNAKGTFFLEYHEE